jgi:tight adherence protein C
MFELFSADSVVLGVVAVLIVLSFALSALGISSIIGVRQLAERRLELPRSISSVVSEGADRISAEDDVLGAIAKYVTPSDPKELSRIRQRLIRAGYRRPSAVRFFYLAKAGLAIGFALIAAFVLPWVAPDLSALLTGLLVVVFMFLGYFFPSFWVERRSEYRKLEVQQGFPDVLDLLLVCVEAGNSVDQSLARVTKEIRSTNAILGDELGITSDELRAGKGRSAAFRDFAGRVNVSDVSAFATVLRQSDEYGTSIADTLRVYASEMRHKRVMRAEEKANIMPLKLVMGTMAFTVPPIMFIMGGPSVLAILTAFSGMGR